MHHFYRDASAPILLQGRATWPHPASILPWDVRSVATLSGETSPGLLITLAAVWEQWLVSALSRTALKSSREQDLWKKPQLARASEDLQKPDDLLGPRHNVCVGHSSAADRQIALISSLLDHSWQSDVLHRPKPAQCSLYLQSCNDQSLGERAALSASLGFCKKNAVVSPGRAPAFVKGFWDGPPGWLPLCHQ